MAKPKNRISRHREAAAELQKGRCIYCGVLMCRGNPGEFAASFGLRPSHAVQLSCTAEHLTAQIDGGRNSISNIAAACRYCNQKRHRRKQPPDPEAFHRLVRGRVQSGKWHVRRVFEAGLL